MRDIIEESFLFLPLLKYFGLYQPQKTTFLYKLRAYALCCIFTISSTILGYVKWYKSPQELVLNYTRNYIERILTCLKWFTQEYFCAKGEKEGKIVTNCVKHCKRISYFYVTGIAAAAIVATVAPLCSRHPKMPILLWLPYDYNSHSLVFCLTYIFVTIGGWYNAVCGCVVDVLLGGLAYHGACQLKILNYNLTNLTKKSKNTHNSLKECAIRHRHILSFVYEYQECFSVIIFCQFAGSIGILVIFIADLFFVPMTAVSSFVSISASFVIMLQLFFYCHYSQLLLEEHRILNQSIYLGYWYKCDMYTQKELIIVMEKTQKPSIITVGTFVDVNLETFCKMLKTMYSLVALLHKFQQNTN